MSAINQALQIVMVGAAGATALAVAGLLRDRCASSQPAALITPGSRAHGRFQSSMGWIPS